MGFGRWHADGPDAGRTPAYPALEGRAIQCSGQTGGGRWTKRHSERRAAAVERLGFEIVGFMTNQAYETREIVLKRMRDMSDRLSSESQKDYDEAMLKAHGISEAFFDIYNLGEDGIGIPLGVFKKP
jgi:hypothetical protein